MNPNQIDLTIPADLKYLNIVGAVIESLLAHAPLGDEREAQAYNVQLAVHELCTNIIEHAYQFDQGKEVELQLELQDENKDLVVRIKDYGRTFDPDAVPEPNLGEPQVRGLGLFLVHELMDAVQYSPEKQCNRWYLKKTLL